MVVASPEIKSGKIVDVSFLGLRVSIGVIFILHGFSKLGNEGFIGWISSMGIPAELGLVIALAEIFPGILLIIGILNRISASIISTIMLGAIFHVKGAKSITGDGGIEFDLILLATSLVIMVAGPGRVSISQIAKKIPRILH